MSSGYLNLFARDLKVLYYHSAAVLQPGKAETWCVTLGMKVVVPCLFAMGLDYRSNAPCSDFEIVVCLEIILRNSKR